MRPVPLSRVRCVWSKAGLYAWSHHPNYIADCLLWLAFATQLEVPMVHTLLAMLYLFGFLIVIPSEERVLELYFGEDYRLYREPVHGLPSRK